MPGEEEEARDQRDAAAQAECAGSFFGGGAFGVRRPCEIPQLVCLQHAHAFADLPPPLPSHRNTSLTGRTCWAKVGTFSLNLVNRLPSHPVPPSLSFFAGTPRRRLRSRGSGQGKINRHHGRFEKDRQALHRPVLLQEGALPPSTPLLLLPACTVKITPTNPATLPVLRPPKPRPPTTPQTQPRKPRPFSRSTMKAAIRTFAVSGTCTRMRR